MGERLTRLRAESGRPRFSRMGARDATSPECATRSRKLRESEVSQQQIPDGHEANFRICSQLTPPHVDLCDDISPTYVANHSLFW